MKFAIVCDTFHDVKGGIERHAQLFKTAAETAGHEVTIASSDSIRSLVNSDVDWIFVEGVHRASQLFIMLNLPRRGPRLGLFTHGSFYESIHSESLRRTGYGPRLAQSLPKRLHDRLLMREYLEKYSFVFALSEVERAELIAHFDLSPRQVRAMPNFIGRLADPSESFVPIPSWDYYKPYVCSVSRLDPRKNLIGAIQAVHDLPINYLIAGQDAGDRNRIVRFIDRHGIRNVRLVGEIPESAKPPLILGSLALLLPSFLEGTPYAVFEALAANRIAICTLNSYLDDMPGLVKVSPNPRCIRDALEELLSKRAQSFGFSYPTDAEILGKLVDVLRSAGRAPPN
jgi:glycosyltransferase involved in cell wall biosynthesis